MKFAEINEMFSKKVAEYLNNGYVLNPTTMGGHQGEIVKIDLNNGHEVVRIWLDRVHADNFHFREGIALTVGRTIKNEYVHPVDMNRYDCLWHNDLEIVEVQTFWQMEREYRKVDWYIEGDEGLAALGITSERHKREYLNCEGEIKEIHFDRSKYRIALNIIRKMPYNKTKKLSDIESFYMITRTGHRAKFFAILKGRKIELLKA